MESRGARVFTIAVPEVNGDAHTGLDDYIAAGENLDELIQDARPFEPVDTGRERLKKDEGLRIFVAAKTREMGELPTRTRLDCNGVKLMRWMLEGPTPAHGKGRERGVEIHPSFPQMAEGIRVGSYKTVSKTLDHLEALEVLERVPGPRGRGKAARYLLLDPSRGGRAQGVNKEGIGGPEKESQKEKSIEEDSRKTTLSTRESSSYLHPTHIGVKSEKAPEKVPALRNSKLVHTYAIREGRKVVVHSDYFKRYGPKPEEILRYVLEQGRTGVSDLNEKFGAKTSRPGRFFKTWLKPMLDDGVLTGDRESVDLSADWSEALERVRARTNEEADNRRQTKKYAERWRNYRERLAGEKHGEVPKSDPTPELAGPERVAEIVDKAAERDRAARVEEQRQKVGTTPETFLEDALQDASGFGWRELRALWVAKGGKPEHLRQAVKHPYRFEREGGDGPLYVVRAGIATRPEHEPAPVAVLREPYVDFLDAVTREEGIESINAAPKKANTAMILEPIGAISTETQARAPLAKEDWRSHPLDCECDECLSPLPTRYVATRSGA
jgi:hypothetical protein